jgi:hypothetical protein
MTRRDGGLNNVTQQLTVKDSDLLYVPPTLTFRNSVFRPQCIYVFCVDLRTNSDYFSLQH